jgi:hypothetical protein
LNAVYLITVPYFCSGRIFGGECVRDTHRGESDRIIRWSDEPDYRIRHANRNRDVRSRREGVHPLESEFAGFFKTSAQIAEVALQLSRCSVPGPGSIH